MKWISIKEKLPDKDCVCVVWNKSRPFNFYISNFSKYFKEFEVYMIDGSRLYDPISFNATHWMPLPETPNE